MLWRATTNGSPPAAVKYTGVARARQQLAAPRHGRDAPSQIADERAARTRETRPPARRTAPAGRGRQGQQRQVGQRAERHERQPDESGRRASAGPAAAARPRAAGRGPRAGRQVDQRQRHEQQHARAARRRRQRPQRAGPAPSARGAPRRSPRPTARGTATRCRPPRSHAVGKNATSTTAQAGGGAAELQRAQPVQHHRPAANDTSEHGDARGQQRAPISAEQPRRRRHCADEQRIQREERLARSVA